jgi:3-dehydroquinate synthase
MNWNIETSLPIKYEIKNSPHILSVDNKDLLNYISKRALVVVDEEVNKLYSNDINCFFNHNNIETHIVVLKGTEIEKNLDNLLILLEQIENFRIDRKNEPIIGIGGGVILDIVGLAATLYRRGVPYIRIPTTLLGIVDVSVAAKTGINFLTRRNRLGSYYPPIVCFLDKTFLKTLDPKEISSGMGEILKMAVIKDYSLFSIIEQYSKQLYETKFNSQHADIVIDKSVQGMIEELENNLWEKNLERCVDYGHSFSPIIEMKSLVDPNIPELLHGQAVTLDVIFSSILSYNRNYLNLNDVKRIIDTAKNMNLPTYHVSFTDPLLLFESLQDTTKHRNGNQNLPIPIEIGKYIFINDVTYEEISNVAKIYKELTYEK